MSDETYLSVFPKTRLESLTMLYLQNQDLSSCTPEQIVDMYFDAYDRIITHNNEVMEKRRKTK